MNKILHLNYPLDFPTLLLSSEKAKEISYDYSDSRYPGHNFDYWKISKYNDDYIQQIITDFGVNGSPRFYWLKPFTKLPVHVDNGTKCSINFVLSEGAAPITYDGVDYFYSQALINTSIPHGVTNGPTERLLLKISIFDVDYAELSQSIKFRKN
jgi:hypothetical protein